MVLLADMVAGMKSVVWDRKEAMVQFSTMELQFAGPAKFVGSLEDSSQRATQRSYSFNEK